MTRFVLCCGQRSCVLSVRPEIITINKKPTKQRNKKTTKQISKKPFV